MRLFSGASQRLGTGHIANTLDVDLGIRQVGVEIERALRTSVSEIDHAVPNAQQALKRHLPQVFSSIICLALEHLRTLPIDAPRRNHTTTPPEQQPEAQLPAWMPSNRILGGFYVLHAIDTGAAGSVFVARRSEERDQPNATRFALKVPQYAGAAARALSEEEFMYMFREEAGALLALPEHPHIGRFVTFDAGAKPKPILVMELVEGPTLARMLEMDVLTTQEAIDILLALGSGLDAMHQVGIGHLDIKPANIIVRPTQQGQNKTRPTHPVLVDFGLAGRHLRPGCGTAHYGAPEIWARNADRSQPIPADVYSFACLVYETLFGEPLFDSDSELGLITMHFNHDGAPEPILALRNQHPELAKLLRSCLRKNPNDRITIRQARQLLANLRHTL